MRSYSGQFSHFAIEEPEVHGVTRLAPDQGERSLQPVSQGSPRLWWTVDFFAKWSSGLQSHRGRRKGTLGCLAAPENSLVSSSAAGGAANDDLQPPSGAWTHLGWLAPWTQILLPWGTLYQLFLHFRRKFLAEYFGLIIRHIRSVQIYFFSCLTKAKLGFSKQFFLRTEGINKC